MSRVVCKQETAYEMRISDWSSDVCSSDLEDKSLREALAHIHRILDVEKFQLELVHPMMKVMLESAPAYDKDPNGSGPFGFTETNPIPVNGPIGQLAYLSRLDTQSGQRILFHRLRAIAKLHVFEAVTFHGSG